MTLTDTDGQGTVTLSDTDDGRRTMTLIEANDGLQGHHDSAVAILAELAKGRVLPCGEGEDSAYGVCSEALLDSVSVTCQRRLRFFHVSCNRSDADGSGHCYYICDRDFLQEQIRVKVQKRQKHTATNMLELARKKLKMASMHDCVFVLHPVG